MTEKPRITIEPPSGMVILAARHLDATEGPVQVDTIVDAGTRSAITTVLRYIATAHNSPIEAADEPRSSCPDPVECGHEAASGQARADLARAERRLRLAHQARRAKEHQLDGIRRALCDAGFMQDDDPYSHADLEDVIRQAAPADTTQPEPATVTDPEWIRQQYAAALWQAAERDIVAEWICCEPLDPKHQLCAQGYAAMRMIKSLIFDGETTLADAVMRVRDRHVDQLRQRLELAAEWTPPPPGSTREQLPETMLDLIRDRLPDYLSTACQTADTLACAACYPGSGVPRPQYDEIREHAERLHERCRLNNKFTGQLCGCGCHPTEDPTPAVGGGR